MISEKMVSVLKKLNTFGCYVYMRKEEIKEGFDYKRRLQDFNDREVMEVLEKSKPSNFLEFLQAMAKSKPDEEISAHLNGFENRQEYLNYLQEVRRLINRM